MKESNTLADNATIKQLKIHKGVKHTCRQCNHQATTKGSLAQHKRAVHEVVKNFVCNATIKQLQREILLNTKRKYMKKSNTLAGNATVEQLQKDNLLDTKG